MLTPRYKKILNICRLLNRFYMLKRDGNISPLWINVLIRLYGDRITLVADVDCENPLLYETKKEIEKEMEDCIKSSRSRLFYLNIFKFNSFQFANKNPIYMVEAESM